MENSSKRRAKKEKKEETTTTTYNNSFGCLNGTNLYVCRNYTIPLKCTSDIQIITFTTFRTIQQQNIIQYQKIKKSETVIWQRLQVTLRASF